ncbi:MAG: hypothetical protein VX733_02065 [Candidatus Latescibacterota bacterium]|nr:hypothetical protein [Candidatus Latescibacterota bacterium]
MRTLLLAVGGLALVATGSSYIIGALLPVRHEVALRTVLDAPPQHVLELISEAPMHSGWRSEVSGDKPPLEAASAIARERLVTRIIDDDLPFGGTWTFVVEPSGAGTRLTITERGEVYHPVIRALHHVIHDPEEMIRTYLRTLKRQLSGVEEPALELR